MAWIDEVPREAAEGDLARLYERIAHARGEVAAIHRVQSLNPRAMDAHMGLYRAVLFRRSPLGRIRRERIGVLVSATNACRYCIAHHGEPLRQLGEAPAVVDELAEGRIPASLPAPDRALLDWARRLTLEPSAATEEDVGELRAHGFGDRALLDANLTVSYFNFVNRLVLGLGVGLEPNFAETCRPDDAGDEPSTG